MSANDGRFEGPMDNRLSGFTDASEGADGVGIG